MKLTATMEKVIDKIEEEGAEELSIKSKAARVWVKEIPSDDENTTILSSRIVIYVLFGHDMYQELINVVVPQGVTSEIVESMVDLANIAWTRGTHAGAKAKADSIRRILGVE